ncbi:MAG: hypothetical protein R2793_00655 [Flavobacteriaceae bacterium]
MKLLTQLFILALLVTTVACRDTQKEEAELNATIEQVDAIDAQLDTISSDIEAKTEDLQQTLEELDSL